MAYIKQKVVVKNSLGLHIRPATEIVKLLKGVKSQVTFTHKKQSINAKSIISLLMLAVRSNGKIEICMDGDDAEAAMEQLVEAFGKRFGE